MIVRRVHPGATRTLAIAVALCAAILAAGLSTQARAELFDESWLTTKFADSEREVRSDAPARRRNGRRVASLGGHTPTPATRPSVTGGVTWHASASCLTGSLASVVAAVAASFGPVRVNSTCRSRGHNARVGGAPRSKHLSGNAVDFRVRGNVSAVHSFLRSHTSVGGLKHYGGGLFHIDTGARRPM